MATDDAALLDAWRAGQTEAGQALLARHFSRLYMFFANKISGDPSDLVQRTMLGCVEGRDRVRDGSSFAAYLLRVARNQLYIHYKGRMAEQRRGASDASVADLSPTPSTLLVGKREQRRLLHALRHIPLELQIILELFYWEEMTMAEMSDVLGVPVGTAKSRLRRAREALAERLERDEAESLRKTTMDDVDRWAKSIRAELAAQRGGAST
ncbi:MAG: sigma-70 family RNA polymerase sigma factor [Myxococcota bacterium]